MALPPSFYNVGDQAIYQGGEHFIPQEKYRLGYYPPVMEEEQLTTATGVGIPYTNAFNNSGVGGGGGDYDYEQTWTREGRPLDAPLSLTSNQLKDKAYWENQPWTSDMAANKAYWENQPDKGTGITGIKDFFSKFNKPRYRGELGDRLEAQYQTGQKLPLFLSKIAGLQSPFNRDSRNYNPNFADQLNYLEGLDNYIGRDPQSGLYKYDENSVLAGQNVFSGFGSNDYEEQLEKQLGKYQETWDTKSAQWDKAKKARWREKFLDKAEAELLAWQNQNKDGPNITTDITTDTITTDDGTIDGGKNYTGDEWKGHGAYGGGEGGVHTGEGTASQTTSTSNQGGGWSPGSGSQGTTQTGDYGFADYNQGGRVRYKKGGRQDRMGGTMEQTAQELREAAPDQFAGGMNISHGGGQGGNNQGNTGGITQLVGDKDVVDVDWLTTKPELNINLDRSKYLAQLDLINSIKNQELEGQIGAQIGPVDFTTMINEGDIGNTNVNYDNWSANFDPNANLQNISYENNIGGWDVGGAYYPENKNLMFNISKTFKHGGLARLL